MSENFDEFADQKKNAKSVDTKKFNRVLVGFAGARKLKNGSELMH